ncbi:MAG: hypothetical protein ACMXYE_01500 [Candidatus Woesearchaeota archaeon]
MATIKRLLFELRYEIFKNILLNVFLKATLAYFIARITLSFFGLPYLFAFIFAGIYFVVVFTKHIRRIRIKIFEEHNPEIKEMLTTAADNMNTSNIVTEELFKEVIMKVRKLSSGTLINPRIVLLIIISLPLLAVASFELSPVYIPVVDQSALRENLDIGSYLAGLINGTRTHVDIPDDMLIEDDIFGDVRIGALGDQEINIQMNLGFETDLTRPREEDTSDVDFKDFPPQRDTDIVFATDVRQEQLQESDLARRYNERIREMN